MLTRKQIALIHVACKELGINEDDRHLIQEEFTGFRSLTKMNYQAWSRLVRYLEARGFTRLRQGYGGPARQNFSDGGPARQNFSDGGRTTDPKLNLVTKIYALWYTLAGTYYEPGNEKKTLRGFLKKRFRVDHENFLTTEQAIKVIEAIKAISARRKEHGA